MNKTIIRSTHACVGLAWLVILGSATTACSQQPGNVGAGALRSSASPTGDGSDDTPVSSTEQGRTPLDEGFDWREWRLEKRREAIKDTQFKFNIRSFFLDREKYDGSESQAFTIGGWAGFKTGYFLDHVAFGATGYTSQPLVADDDRDGTLLLKPGGQGYTVLGEAYTDIRIVDDINLYVGRKEFDTPFINRNDTRMTPNTFEAIALQGKIELGPATTVTSSDSKDGKDLVVPVKDRPSLKFGIGYFDRIKERNSDRFISMAKDAGADVSRGVFVLGANLQKGDFSIGAIDYYSPDIINILYAETKVAIPVSKEWRPKLALQFIDQRSVGDDLLQGDSFSAQQFGIKADLPWENALFTAGYTYTTDGRTNMQSPWSGYPGYTSVQVEDFNRAGERAVLLRAAYKFKPIDGLSAYALWVHGMAPSEPGQFARDESNLNVEWVPTKGYLKGLGIRVRYARVHERGDAREDLKDFRVICNYAFNF